MSGQSALRLSVCGTIALLGCMRSQPAATSAQKSASPADPSTPLSARSPSPSADRAGVSVDPAILGLRDLQYSREAREEYGGADLREGEVYAVIVEIGVEGTVVMVAGFKDGTSRLIMGKGGGVLGNKNDFPAESRVVARQLVEAATPLLSTIPLETGRPLPHQGNARFALLTRGGSHAAERSIDSLESQKADLSSLWGPTNHLLGVLLQFQRRGQSP